MRPPEVLDDEVLAAVDRALDDHHAVIVRRVWGDRVVIVPDSMIIELAANGHALTDGTTVGRDDGRAVLVFVLVYGSAADREFLQP
jgi:hypothetical protein